jgi:hypothetical protein
MLKQSIESRYTRVNKLKVRPPARSLGWPCASAASGQRKASPAAGNCSRLARVRLAVARRIGAARCGARATSSAPTRLNTGRGMEGPAFAGRRPSLVTQLAAPISRAVPARRSARRHCFKGLPHTSRQWMDRGALSPNTADRDLLALSPLPMVSWFSRRARRRSFTGLPHASRQRLRLWRFAPSPQQTAALRVARAARPASRPLPPRKYHPLARSTAQSHGHAGSPTPPSHAPAVSQTDISRGVWSVSCRV